MNEMTQVLGIVAMEPKGEYSPTAYYEKLNVVTCGDFTYMAKESVTGEHPSSSNKWLCIGGVVDDAVSVVSDIATMKTSTNLVAGMIVETKGYYASGDGGGAKYEIVDDDELIDDGGSIHDLDNGLKAVLLIENDTINFRQLGAKSDDNTFDNKDYLKLYETLCNRDNKTYKLLIPYGKWYFSPTHFKRVGGANIEGWSSFYGGRGIDYGTQILAIDNQDYIWKFGGASDMLNTELAYNSTNTSNKISGLTFSTGSNAVSYGCLVLEYANYGFYDDLTFKSIKGTGLYIRSSWENYFDRLLFRSMPDYSTPCLKFAQAREISGVSANISSSSFDKIMFETSAGDMIYFEYGSNFVNNQFGEINIENNTTLATGDTTTAITNETDLSTMTPFHVINGYFTNTHIGRIVITGSVNSMENYITTANGNKYYYKSIINIGDYVANSQANLTTFTVGDIVERNYNQILSCNSSYPAGCSVIINSINGECPDSPVISYNKIDVKQFGSLVINSMKTRFEKDVVMSVLNEVEFYKICSRGTVYSNSKANNNTKLVASKNPDSVWLVKNGCLKYPFEYSQTKKKIFGLKIIPDSNGSYFISVRGTVNGSEVTKNYSGSSLTPNTLTVIPIEMNYDFGCSVMFLNPTADVGFQSFYYIGEEDI